MHYLSKIKLESFIVFIVFILAAFLRFYNLGYSDYQGDEIKALFNTKDGKDFFEFIFDQRKGPGQFTVTKLVKEISDSYLNYIVVRLPFAIAGFFSTIVFYFVVKNFYNSKIALFSTVFFGSSGFLVAFSRIVQYQSFVILLGLLAILFAQFYLQNKKLHFLLAGSISIAFSVLFHYDGIFFAVPFALILLKETVEKKERKRAINSAILSFLIIFGILASFYIPFVLNIKSSTLDYFQERIEGVGGNTKISSSIFNFNLYQPYFSFYFYITFLGFGILSLRNNYKSLNTVLIITWVVIPLIFMEFFIKSPGTHIYTYLIPSMIITGLGINFLFELSKNQILKILTSLLITLISIHLFLQSYVLFVDHSKEYPWQDKKYLYFELNALTQKDNKKYYLSVFGFPYNRNWLEIKNYLKDKTGKYDSSEKNSIGNFYISNLEFEEKSKIYIEIEKPQSFSNSNRKGETPEIVFENKNETKSTIYFLK